MTAYLATTATLVALAMFAGRRMGRRRKGGGKLSPLAIIVLAAVGLWPDPNPNPIGPGLLFFFTFWPAVACLSIGAFQVRRRS